MPPQGVDSVQGRLDTFEIAHPVKRRGSTTKKRSPATLSWPHKLPSPDALAKAGFYFHPSASSPDNVRCFCCNVNLDGWEPEDDPTLEHYTHRNDCAWATCRFLKHSFEANQIVEEDPMSESHVNARHATFEDWPHESKRGWKCKKEKMVEAGWHFDPSPGGEDGVTCSYCSTELAGWERKDDPFEEHLKREPDCAFFALCDRFASNRPTKPKRVRTSKASRASVQSNMSAMNDNISIADLDMDDNVEAAGDDTIITTATSSPKVPKGRKKASTKTAKAKSKKISIMEDEPEIVEASELGLSTSQQVRKGRSKKNAATDDSVMTATELGQSTSQPTRKPRTKKIVLADESAVDINELSQSSSQPVRQTRRKASRQVSAQIDASTPEVAPKPTRAKGKKAIIAQPAEDIVEEIVSKPHRGKKRASDGSEKNIHGDYPTTNNTYTQLGQSRGTKRTSDGRSKLAATKGRLSALEKLDSSVVMLDDAPEIFEDSPEKPAKRAKKVSSIRPPLQELEPADVQRDSDAFMFRSSNMFEANTSTPRQDTPEAFSDVGSPNPPTPTPARVTIPVDRRNSQRTRASATPLLLKASTRVSTPSLSPQSSDAENRPPSSRRQIRSLQLQPVSPVRVALQTTPKTSPAKRSNIVSHIQTTVKWTPADLENVFVRGSPSKQSPLDKENFIPGDAHLDMKNLDCTQLAETIKAVRQTITADERKMTVAEWIEHTGNVAAERLRKECDLMVSMFESEAAKGMRTLESIEVFR